MLGLSHSTCGTFHGRAVHVPKTGISVAVGGELRTTGTKTVKVAHMEETGREGEKNGESKSPLDWMDQEHTAEQEKCILRTD